MKNSEKSISIQVQNNPKATAQEYLLMHVGMNIQIDRIKKISRYNYKILLRAVLPYRITLENGDRHVGYVQFKKMGSLRVVKKKRIWKVVKSSVTSNDLIDKKLAKRANDYRRLLKIKELMWV